MKLMYDLTDCMPTETMMRNCAEMIITGSWQYGTANEESDVDVVYIHDMNIVSDVFNVVHNSDISNTQKSGTFLTNGVEKEYDIRFLSYTDFVRKLYSADINCVEYICSPYNGSYGSMGIMGDLRYIFFERSLPDPYYKYKLLRSLMGFINPINRKKSKKFIIPEKVNQNNLIKIANLYFLLKNHYYPLNPELGISCMRDDEGHTVELIDAESPYYNSTEIMLATLERYNKELEEKYPKELEQKIFPAGKEYETVLKRAYEQPTK